MLTDSVSSLLEPISLACFAKEEVHTVRHKLTHINTRLVVKLSTILDQRSHIHQHQLPSQTCLLKLVDVLPQTHSQHKDGAVLPPTGVEAHVLR